MIEYKAGDILNADVEALVNTVNCVGVMGRGIALQFRKKFPPNYKAYQSACERKEIRPGHMFVFETGGLINPRYIINFPTKRHWRGKSRMEDIETGLDALAGEIRAHGIRSIAIPPLGSGLGGLDWPDVRARITQTFADFPDVNVIVFEPAGAPAPKEMVYNKAIPNMTAGRAALVGLIDRYLRGMLDPLITLLEVHKLMYFLQEAGEPLRLKYKKAYYGPYAENLGHVLSAVEGHLISGYADGGDAPGKQIDLLPGAMEEAQELIAERTDTRRRCDRVADLVDGFETSFGLELLATVHWIAKKENPLSPADLIAKTHAWNARKKQFTERQIKLALKVLVDKDWVDPLAGSA